MLIRYKRPILVVVILLMVLVGCDKKGGDITSRRPGLSDLMSSTGIQPLDKPETAPDFELLAVNEESRSLKGYRGKVLILSFWTTW